VLHIAASKDHSVICTILLENGVDFDAVDDNLDNGMSVLFYACPKQKYMENVLTVYLLNFFNGHVCLSY
jgi:hypothetical protein